MTMTSRSRGGGSCASATEAACDSFGRLGAITHMKTLAIGTHALLVFAWLGLAAPHGLTAVERQTSQKPAAPAAKPADDGRRARPPARADRPLSGSTARADAALLPPIPARWRRSANGSPARRSKEPSCRMRRRSRASSRASWLWSSSPRSWRRWPGDLAWTTRLGQAFAADRSAVFASIQRLRVKARDAGKLKSTPQQDVETQHHVERPAGGRDRAGQPAGRLRSAVQPADRLHHVVHGGRSAGKQQQ